MKTMFGAHDEGVKDNPPVRSKFDKSHGKGLPAPHLKHPGQVAPDTGTRVPGHTENGHQLPIHRSLPMGGHQVTRHEVSSMGTNMYSGQGLGTAKNTKVTDSQVVKSSHRVGMSGMHGTHEPDPVHAGSDKHSRQHSTGRGSEHGKSGSPQHQDNHSSRSRAPHGTLDRTHMKGRS
jgi:hypothetical protein